MEKYPLFLGKMHHEKKRSKNGSVASVLEDLMSKVVSVVVNQLRGKLMKYCES